MAPKSERSSSHVSTISSSYSGSSESLEERSTASDAYYFLSSHARQHLPGFEYRGADLSLTYHYVLSPLAAACVEWTPRSIAPNTITLVGLLFMIAAYAAMWYHVPELYTQEEPPRWIFLANAVAILLYQTLDNMDGKQARRTGSSSPLGLLFDHGCDAVNSLFGSANWITAMALHPHKDAWLLWIVLFGPYALFYIGTWEEYYTGALIMPIVNGPNEGLLGAVAMSLTSYWYGPAYWQSTSWWTAAAERLPVLAAAPIMLRNCDLLVLASSIGFVQECSLKILGVARQYGGQTLLHLVPFGTLLVSSLAVAAVDVDIWLQSPRTSLHLCAVLFVEATTALMLAHMCQERYEPFRWPLIPLMVFTLLVVGGYLTSTTPHANLYLSAYLVVAAAYLVVKTTMIIREICQLLDIWCFDIVTPRPSATRTQKAARTTRRVKAE